LTGYSSPICQAEKSREIAEQKKALGLSLFPYVGRRDQSITACGYLTAAAIAAAAAADCYSATSFIQLHICQLLPASHSADVFSSRAGARHFDQLVWDFGEVTPLKPPLSASFLIFWTPSTVATLLF